MRSKRSSYDELQRDWRELLDDCGARLPDLDLSGSLLSWALGEMQTLRGMREGLDNARRRLTERLRDVRELGWDEARRCRGLLTSEHAMQDTGAMRSRWNGSPEGSERRRTMREKTRSGQLGEWQRLLMALQGNQAELAFLDTQRTQLETLVSQAEDFFQSQAALAASKQDASQKLAALVAECQRLSTVLRFSLKQFYGPTSEKLVEFGIQPFRGRNRKKDLPPPPAESTEPADLAPAVD